MTMTTCVLATLLMTSRADLVDVSRALRSCPADTVCDADDMMMIQSLQGSQGKHRASTQVARVGQQRAALFLEKVQHMADQIVSGEEKITDATRQALDTIDQEMDDIIAHASQNQKDFQGDVDRAEQFIETCGADTTTAHTKAGGINDIAAAVDTARNNHNTCRSDEATLKHDATTKCNDFSSYKANLQAPSCSCSGTAISEQCILESKTWFTTAASSWSSNEGLCDDATTVHSEERTVCNSEQGGLETDFCVYATALKMACSTQETCRSEQIGLRNQAHAAVAVSESAFKAEYESAKHVKCILNVLNATDDAKQGLLSACKSATIDSSHLSITYHPIPSAATCDLTPVNEQPGDNAWVIAEYGGKAWNVVGKAPVIATVSCPAAAPTTAAPVSPTTAAPTDAPTVPALPACGLKFIKFISGQQCNNRRFSGFYVKDASGKVLENGCEHTTALHNGNRGPPWSNPACKAVGTSCTDWKFTLGGSFHREDYNWVNNAEMATNRPGDGAGGWNGICGGVAMYSRGSYQIEFPSIQHISAYAADGITTGERLYVDTWTVQGSLDGTNWFDLDDKSSGVDGMSPQNTFTGWLPINPVSGCEA